MYKKKEEGMDSRKILHNKTYQPMQILVNGTTCIVGARGKSDNIIINKVTPQMKNLLKKRLITIKDMK